MCGQNVSMRFCKASWEPIKINISECPDRVENQRLGVRAIGRANSGTLFQGAQIRANHLAHGSGLGKEGVETRVAGLLTASDATYGEKNMPWHGSYGKRHIA